MWETVARDPHIHSVEHPVLNVKLPKHEFAEEFRAVLVELDGRSLTDFVDFFFEPDTVDKGILCFRGEDVRQDFFEWAVDVDCCPPLDKIKSGDDHTSSSSGGSGSDSGQERENRPTAGNQMTAAKEREAMELELDRVRAREGAKKAAQQRKTQQAQKTRRKRETEPQSAKLRRTLIGRVKGLTTLQTKLASCSSVPKKTKLQAKMEKAMAALEASYNNYRCNFPVVEEVETVLR